MDRRWSRRSVTWMAAAAAIVLLCAAGDPSRPLRPPHAPDVPRDALFFDDFSRGTAKWEFDRPEAWSVRSGSLRGVLPDKKQQRAFAYAGSEDWRDYAVDLDVCQVRGVDKGVVVRVRGKTGTAVDVRGRGYRDVLLYRGESQLASAPVSIADGRWHHLRVECRGASVAVALDGRTVLRHEGSSHGDAGRIALPAYTGGVGECEVWYANVLVTPLK